MTSIDTNVLIRFLVNDDKVQSEKVLKYFENCEKQKESILILNGVILETIWVLNSAYTISNLEIVESLSKLLSIALFEFESRETIHFLIKNFSKANCDLDDYFLACQSMKLGAINMLTFDKKALKYEHFMVI